MLLRSLVLIGAGVAALAAAAPARADDWRDGGRWRQDWHHGDWHDHWRWDRGRPWAYAPPPPVYYAPPPVYYAPPPPPPPRFYGPPPGAYYGFGWR